MPNWEREIFQEVINDGHFEVADVGPLHSPIRMLTIKRNEKFNLIIETKCPSDAQSTATEFLPGTIRVATESVQLKGFGGVEVALGGVVPYHYETHWNGPAGIDELREEASARSVDVLYPRPDAAAYVIDWLENVDRNGFIWPDRYKTETVVSATRTLGLSEGAPRLMSSRKSLSGNDALRLVVSGVELYLCVADSDDTGKQISPGFIVYMGTPDEETRKKIRNCVSFVLGVFLVYLGHTVYSATWSLVSLHSVAAHSIDKKVFGLPGLPPAPLHASQRNGIDGKIANRIVNAIYSHYDALEFGPLYWAYWYALCAPLHIGAVQFGAVIEALQRTYVALHPQEFSTKILSDKDQWSSLRTAVEGQITSLNVGEDQKLALKANLGLLNQVPRRIATEGILKKIGIQIGAAEGGAWRRRHNAAHGNEIVPGSEPEIIRDTKLLRITFHRMLLGITGASSSYTDYYSIGFPIRPLQEPVPTLNL